MMPRKLTPRRARALSKLRKSHRGGRPRVLKPCPRCGAVLGVSWMRVHECADVKAVGD